MVLAKYYRPEAGTDGPSWLMKTHAALPARRSEGAAGSPSELFYTDSRRE